MKTEEYHEGKTRLIVPSASLEQDPPPTAPVFFNPAASINRDASVSIVAATEGRSFCDSMAGVGARGVRVAREVGRIESLALVDFNSDALKLAKRSASLNRIARKCEFSASETSAYLHSRYGREKRFDYVDVDPFGTPIRQLQAAISATADGGVLSMTATDTAVLCGVYPKVSRRRYGSASLNNSFNHETGIRILLGAIAREGASLDVGIEPVAAHSTRHYLRVFARVLAGAQRADRALGNIGFVIWCPFCGHAQASTEPEKKCEKCGKKTRVAGPLWLGEVSDEEVVRRSVGEAVKIGLESARGVLASLGEVNSFPPWSFSIDEICSSLGKPTAAEDAVYHALTEKGFRSLRTPFEKTGIKTDAPFSEVVSAVEAVLSGGSERSHDDGGS